jgi:hypothetical protein
MPSGYSESSYSMALVGLRNHLIGDKLASLRLRHALSNRCAGFIVQPNDRCIHSGHGKHHRRDRFLVFIRKLAHLGDCLFKKLSHVIVPTRILTTEVFEGP